MFIYFTISLSGIISDNELHNCKEFFFEWQKMSLLLFFKIGMFIIFLFLFFLLKSLIKDILFSLLVNSFLLLSSILFLVFILKLVNNVIGDNNVFLGNTINDFKSLLEIILYLISDLDFGNCKWWFLNGEDDNSLENELLFLVIYKLFLNCSCNLLLFIVTELFLLSLENAL